MSAQYARAVTKAAVRRPLLVVPAVLAAGLSLQASTHAQEAAQSAKPQGTIWLVRCDNARRATELACTMSLRVTDQASGQQVAAATIARIQSGSIIRFSLPHGIQFSEGARIAVDGGSSTRLDVVSADSKSAYTSIDLSGSLLQDLKRGNELKVSVTALNGNVVNVTMPLIGFAAAHELYSAVGS